MATYNLNKCKTHGTRNLCNTDCVDSAEKFLLYEIRGSLCYEDDNVDLLGSALKLETVGFSETLVSLPTCESTRRHNPVKQ